MKKPEARATLSAQSAVLTFSAPRFLTNFLNELPISLPTDFYADGVSPSVYAQATQIYADISLRETPRDAATMREALKEHAPQASDGVLMWTKERLRILDEADGGLRDAIDTADVPTLRDAILRHRDESSPEVAVEAAQRLTELEAEAEAAMRREIHELMRKGRASRDAIVVSSAGAYGGEEGDDGDGGDVSDVGDEGGGGDGGDGSVGGDGGERHHATATKTASNTEGVQGNDALGGTRSSAPMEAEALRSIVEAYRDKVTSGVLARAEKMLKGVDVADAAVWKQMSHAKTDLKRLVQTIHYFGGHASPSVVNLAHTARLRLEAEQMLRDAPDDYNLLLEVIDHTHERVSAEALTAARARLQVLADADAGLRRAFEVPWQQLGSLRSAIVAYVDAASPSVALEAEERLDRLEEAADAALGGLLHPHLVR